MAKRKYMSKRLKEEGFSEKRGDWKKEGETCILLRREEDRNSKKQIYEKRKKRAHLIEKRDQDNDSSIFLGRSEGGRTDPRFAEAQWGKEKRIGGGLYEKGQERKGGVSSV